MLRPHTILIGMLVAIVCAPAVAQRGVDIHDHLLIRDSNRYLYGLPDETYEGSPFLNDDFLPATLYVGAKKLQPVLMRYNIFADVMEFRDGNQTFILEADPRITKLTLGDHTFVVRNFQYLAKKTNGFLEVVEDGKLILYAKKLVNYRRSQPLQSIPAKFSRLDDTWYLQAEGSDPAKVTNLKQVLSMLPDKHDEVSAFIKREKISIKNRNDLVAIVRYYNGMFTLR